MTDMVEHSSQDQDGEYYRKMDVRLGHSRRDVVFGYMLNLGCGLGDAGERYYSGEGNAVFGVFPADLSTDCNATLTWVQS